MQYLPKFLRKRSTCPRVAFSSVLDWGEALGSLYHILVSRSNIKDHQVALNENDIRLYATGNNGKTLPDCRSFSSLPWANNSSDTLDILKKGASWRTLQIQDPPATTLIVEKRVADRGADNVSRRILSFPNGVRMGLLYDLAWEHCARFDCYFGVRWDGIPLSDDEAAKSPRQLGYHVAKWRSETFLPTLGGEEVVLLELYFGEQWFLLNYKTGQGVPDNRVQEWEKFRSEGMGEGETGCLVNTESIPDQVYKME